MIQKIRNAVKSLRNSQSLRHTVVLLWLPFSMLYMEILAKLEAFGVVFEDKFPYLMVLSLSMGFLLSCAAMLLPGKGRRILIRVILALLAVWFSFHITYFDNFHTFFSWQSLGQALDITDFWRESIAAALRVWHIILGFFVPLVLSCCLDSFFVPDKSKISLPFAGVSLALFSALYFSEVAYINGFRDKTYEYTPYFYYTYLQNDLEQSYHYFGIINTTRLDFKQLLFGAPEYLIQADDLNVSGSDYHRSDGESDDGWNVMDLDFEKASASTDSVKLKHLDTYFSNMQPTRRNQYTGMFKGKNLIFLTLEGFSDKVIDPEFTPTLYKMSTEGFVFRNYYNSVWGGSTGSGEYANMTGNIYLNSSCLKKSGDTYQPFALGNQFSALGYRTLAYHNHTYTYYGRNLSHPNFGYEWKAIGNGLVLQSENWPNSDKELAEATVGDYAGIDRPFHVYYMTVSGHCNYSFSGNMMSTRHRYDLPEKYKSDSAEVRAYRACQYEVELMLRVLVDELDKAGKLENTVFAMTADHYPYALSNSSLAELYGLNASGIRGNPELYRNGFILWSPSMKEPVTVDTPCSAIDILPTLSNLFALEYDSRLMMGTDILADGEHIVPLKMDGWSWISTQGEYRCYNSRFYPNEKCTLGSDEMKDYVDTVNRMILAKITYSKNLLDYDYYGHIFGKQHNYDN